MGSFQMMIRGIEILTVLTVDSLVIRFGLCAFVLSRVALVRLFSFVCSEVKNFVTKSISPKLSIFVKKNTISQ